MISESANIVISFVQALILSYLRVAKQKKYIMNKPIIYQMLPRLWGNNTPKPKKNGNLTDNGTGKFSDIDNGTLEYLKWLG